jgi:hypothetical protein
MSLSGKNHQGVEKTMKKMVPILCLMLLFTGLRASAQTSLDSIASPDDKSGYKIDKPGTITFTVSLVIKGKAEKPQVVIFLPKEKSLYEPMTFNRSFIKDIMKPLPLVPVTE